MTDNTEFVKATKKLKRAIAMMPDAAARYSKKLNEVMESAASKIRNALDNMEKIHGKIVAEYERNPKAVSREEYRRAKGVLEFLDHIGVKKV